MVSFGAAGALAVVVFVRLEAGWQDMSLVAIGVDEMENILASAALVVAEVELLVVRLSQMTGSAYTHPSVATAASLF